MFTPITATQVTRHGWLHHALNGEAMNLSQIFPPSVSGDPGLSVSVGPNPPASPIEGQQWLNNNDGYLYIYYDNAGNPTWMSVERET